MSRRDVLSLDMERLLRRLDRDDRLRIDETTAERIFSGAMTSDDVPPAYRGVTIAFERLRSAPTEAELTGEAAAVASMVAAATGGSHQVFEPRTSPVRNKRRIVSTASATLVGSLSLFTGLAAANALPDAAQSVASDVLSHVGVTVHDPNAHAGTHPDTRGKSTDHTEEAPTTPTTGTGKGSDISQLAHTTPSTGVDKGAAISTEASGGKSQAGQHGAAATNPATGTTPVTTPNPGGTGTATTASGDKSSHGATNADTRSDGHSVAGSQNASGAPGTKP